MDKVWYIEDPDEASSRGDEPRGNARKGPKQKNPAVALSLSLVFWGGGQLYNRDRKLGILLVLLMANFWAFLVAGISSWQVLSSDFRPYLSSSNLLFAGWVSSVFALLIWFSGALQAYRNTDKGRATPYAGVEKRLLPPLCSLLIPGWGQFLNGQVKKGALSMLASALSFSAILSIVVLFVLWPGLEPSPTRAILEWNFALSLAIVPFFALIWLVGIIDAFKVSSDEVKKESWLKRASYARNRVRLKGWRNTVFRRARITVPLFLLLVLAIFAGYRFLHAGYYESFARQIGAELSAREMVIVPRVIERFLEGNS
ncbi:MAG: hypothetical protein PVG55_00330 [Nitrospirota bacterium]|jgi:hypothetical protein